MSLACCTLPPTRIRCGVTGFGAEGGGGGGGGAAGGADPMMPPMTPPAVPPGTPPGTPPTTPPEDGGGSSSSLIMATSQLIGARFNGESFPVAAAVAQRQLPYF